MTTSDETCCFIRRNSKNGYHIQKAAKADFVIQNEGKQKQNKGMELWSKVQSLCHYTTEPINGLDHILFKHIIVYNYTRTSKQKFPFCVRSKRRIPFYSNDVIFMYEYCTTLSYKITNKSCSIIRSRRVPYNCPLFKIGFKVYFIFLNK